MADGQPVSDQKADEQSDIGRPRQIARGPRHDQVGDERHDQHQHDGCRDHEPGAAEMQAELGDGLGLHQHEAGAEKEERQIAAVDRIGKSDGLAHEEVAEDQDDPERDHVGEGIGALDHVEERPVVGRDRGFRIGLREMVGDVGEADRGEGTGVRHRHRAALLDDEGGGLRIVVEHPHRQRLAGAGQLPEDLRQLEAERVVDQRERNRQHAVRLEQLEGLGDSLAGIDVGIDAQIGGMAERGVRIQHAVDDQVVFLVGGAEEVARIVDRQIGARVVCRAAPGDIWCRERRWRDRSRSHRHGKRPSAARWRRRCRCPSRRWRHAPAPS